MEEEAESAELVFADLKMQEDYHHSPGQKSSIFAKSRE
jgi:hypothetical protein